MYKDLNDGQEERKTPREGPGFHRPIAAIAPGRETSRDEVPRAPTKFAGAKTADAKTAASGQ